MKDFVDEHAKSDIILKYFPTENKEFEKLPR